jgi:hypothetical protein
MEEGFKFGCSFTIWDPDKNERVKISFGTCRNPSIAPIYGPCGVENCILV